VTKLRDRLAEAVEGRYEVREEMGRGGMSMVFEARDTRHDRTVALKVLLPELAASVGAQRFLREIEIAAHLVHPHILPLYDSGDAGGLLYHVTPCVEGETLRDRLKRERILPIEETVRITAEVADALDYAHAQGVIHRDIKPENVLLTRGHALITDFGIARAITLGGTERLTETGMAVGTPAYMSPEQARGESELDGRSDIYSLACMTYEMLAGEAPLAGRTPQITMVRRQSETPVSLSLLRETVPEPLEGAVLRALSRLPVDRYATAGQFGDAVQMAAGLSTGGYAGVGSSGPISLPGTVGRTTSTTAAPARGGRLTFWEELKRRKVPNVVMVYLPTAWFVVEASTALLEDLGVSGMDIYVWGAMALGLPIAVILAWFFEVNREGVRRTGTYSVTEGPPSRWPLISRRALLVAAGLVLLFFVIRWLR
jgi:serine/threonine-protein kinase